MIINLSKILRYSLVVLLNILCVLVMQYFFNIHKDLSYSISNLQTAIFVNENSEKTNEDILEQLSNNKFDIVDIFDFQSNDKILEITPELSSVVNNDFITFPRFVVVKNLLVNSVEEIEQLKNEILQLDFVEDFVYDQKAYKMFFDNKRNLNSYKNIFYYCFVFICVIFILKFLFFMLKGLFKDIFIEIISGGALGLVAYALICLVAPFFNQSQNFILDWQVLYVVVPLSFMITLLTKESNV